MKRAIGAFISAVLLAGVLVAPVLAGKPATIHVSVTGPTSGCSGIVVSATWDRPQHGQALLTLYLRDNNTSYQRYVQFAVGPTDTSGSATFAIESSPGFTGSLYGIASLNRSFTDPHKPYQLLLTALSAPPVAVPNCNVLSST